MGAVQAVQALFENEGLARIMLVAAPAEETDDHSLATAVDSERVEASGLNTKSLAAVDSGLEINICWKVSSICFNLTSGYPL